MSIRDLIKKHEAELKKGPQEMDAMQAKLEQALVTRCKIWFGDYWDELTVDKVEMKRNSLSVYLVYEAINLEIRFSLTDGPKAITPISEHPLPTLNWGREKFPTPISDERIAQIFFDAQLSRKGG